MRLIARSALVIACAVNSLGCGAGQKPPPAAVLDVEAGQPPRATTAPSGGTPSNRDDAWQQGIATLAKSLGERLRWNTRPRMRVAVLDFSTPEGATCGLGAPLAEELTTRLFDEEKFAIIERRMLARVLAENAVTQTDLFDPEAVARLGRLMGADGVVTGTITSTKTGYTVNGRIIVVESAEVSSVGQTDVPRSSAEQRGSCRGGTGAAQGTPSTDGEPDSEARPAGQFLFEDFSKAREGTLPAGWVGGDKLMVVKVGRSKALSGSERFGDDAVVIPNVRFPTDFEITIDTTIQSCAGNFIVEFGRMRAGITGPSCNTNILGSKSIQSSAGIGQHSKFVIRKEGDVFRFSAGGQDLLLERISGFTSGDQLKLWLYGDKSVLLIHSIKGTAL